MVEIAEEKAGRRLPIMSGHLRASQPAGGAVSTLSPNSMLDVTMPFLFVMAGNQDGIG